VCGFVLFSNSTFQEVWPHLYKLAKGGKSPVAKVAGVDALAVVCFCCSEDPVSTHEVMGQLQGLWKQGEVEKQQGAGRGGGQHALMGRKVHCVRMQ
jgi:hypothetical protein